MCTAFIKKGKDLIVGFNFDIAIGTWDYKIYKKKDMFYIGIKIGSTIYKIHGINKNGNFANLLYMNDMEKGIFKRGKEYQRIDLLVDRYINGSLSFNDVLNLLKEKEIVNVPNLSMHSLISNKDGNIVIVEPGLGYKEIEDNYAVLTNFPVLEEIDDLSSIYYGKDRYDKAKEILLKSTDDFNALDGMKLLEEVKQEGTYATRVSFVYSKNLKTVYYVENNDFGNIQIHKF